MGTPDTFSPWQEPLGLTTSMEDFEATPSPRISRHSSALRIPALQSPIASIYSDVTEEGMADSWSPPAWRKAGSGWFKRQGGLASPLRSRAATPDKSGCEEEEEDEDVTAASIPLPGSRSPTKGRSMSPEAPKAKALPPSNIGKILQRADSAAVLSPAPSNKGESNYIRFSIHADVQHRTAPIEDAFNLIRKTYAGATKSVARSFLSLVTCLLAASTLTFLFTTHLPDPAPDLVKVAGMASTFEPLMYYSETGHSQVIQLGDTGVAVWDLGESVRSTNMTSGPIIVRELDDLAESLKRLAQELSTFFANINGDIDSILIVMEWTQRELTKLSSMPESRASVVFTNVHTLLTKVGVFAHPTTGAQNAVGKFVQDLFGPTAPQRTRNTLQRTFMEFLGVLEESINNELTASQSLFAHFEAIDRQFLNLQRSVIRETDEQEREESEVLASLWSRLIGANATRLKKFEKNKQLLASLRGRTVQNKHVLVDHNGRLLQLRSSLEILRKKLVSPLVRSNQSSTLTVEEQLHGLDGIYLNLRAKREAQKARIYEAFNEGSAAGSRNAMLVGPDEANMIASQ